MQSAEFFNKCNQIIMGSSMEVLSSFCDPDKVESSVPQDLPFLDDSFSDVVSSEVNLFSKNFNEGGFLDDTMSDSFIERPVIDTPSDVAINTTWMGIQSVSVLPQKPSLEAENPVLQYFVHEMLNDMFTVTDSISYQYLWNNNFYEDSTSEEEAFRKLIILYFNFAISLEALQTHFKLITVGFLQAFANFPRELDANELGLLLQNYTSTWFDLLAFRQTAVASKFTGTVLSLMRAGRYNRQEALGNIKSVTAFSEYLLRVNREPSTENRLDVLSGRRPKTNIEPFTEWLGTREDVGEIRPLLEAALCRKTDFTLNQLKRFSTSRYFKEILSSFGTESYSEEFVAGYLMPNIELPRKILDLYTTGELNLNLFEECQFNIWFTLLKCDMRALNIDTNCRIFSITGNKEQLSAGVHNVVSSYYNAEISSCDYAQLLFLFSREELLVRYIKSLSVCKIVSFNHFIVSSLLNYNNIQFHLTGSEARNLGDGLILVTPSGKMIAQLIENLVFDYERILEFFKDNQVSVHLLHKNAGVCFATITKDEQPLKRALNYYSIVPGSLRSWGTGFNQVKLDFYGLNPSERYNFIVLLNQMGESARSAMLHSVLFRDAKGSRMVLEERAFGYILQEFPELKYLLSTKQFEEYFSYVMVLCNTKCRSAFLYRFLDLLLTKKYSSKYVSKKLSSICPFSELEDKVCLEGLPVQSADYKAFFQGFSGFRSIFDNANRIELDEKSNMLCLTVR